MGQGMLAVLAAECAAAGLDIDATLEAVESQIPVTRTFAIVSDMQYAVRGGRLPHWVKKIADLLRLIPIICTTNDGRISLSGFLVGRHKRIERFARHVARRSPAGRVEVGIGHAICKEDALELERQLRRLIPDIEKLVVTGLGPGIGVHGGPGSLLVSVRPWVSAQDFANRTD
jgi:DegV family protein with EDD domain